jgi:exosortase N
MGIQLSKTDRKHLVITLLLVGGLSLLSFSKLAFYFRFDLNFILLLMILPFVIYRESAQKSYRYGIVSIVLLGLYFWFSFSTLFFFAYICAFFFIFESFYGKLNLIPLFLMIIVSPLIIFLTEVVGFELRLELTKVAAQLLHLVDNQYSYSGNIILIGEKEFHVDPECMGLKMVILSFFTSLLFITYFHRKKEKIYSFVAIIIILIITYILDIVSNLFRIMLITLVQSKPETFSHDLIGIICFIAYVAFPLWFVIQKFPFQKKNQVVSEIKNSNKKIHIAIGVFVMLFFLVSAFIPKGHESGEVSCAVIPSEWKKNFYCSIEEHGVFKMSNSEYLIYIKPSRPFYSSDHTPLICWKGSGYKIEKEEIINIGSQKVYFGELKKGKDILYTAWWYDSGDEKTISQFQWRINSLLKGKKYQIINVISDSKNKVLHESDSLISNIQ